MKRYIYTILFLITTLAADAQISLLRDINQGGATTGANPNNFVTMGSFIYYSANDGVRGVELWRTDGTPGGTAMVKDINPGDSSYPDYMVVVGSTLYFTASDGENGFELWKSDGTAAGTVMVDDIYAGFGDSYPSYTVAIGSTALYFSAEHPDYGNELFKLDIATNTVSLVSDINVGTPGSYPYLLTYTTGTTIYFNADDGNTGSELWKSDGSGAGTTRIKDIWSGPNGSYPDYITVVSGSTVIFNADDGTNGPELWMTNGTSVGTTMTSNINATAGEGSYPYSFKVFGSFIYFTADNGTNGPELWRTNLSGTSATMFEINTGVDGSYPDGFTIYNSTMFFSAYDASNGYELWRTTAGGTPTQTIFNAGTASGSPNGFIVFNSLLWFTATQASTGAELWRYNGSIFSITEIVNGATGGNPRGYTPLGSNLIFTATDGSGYEVWKHNGTTASVVLDALSGSGGSNPNTFVYNGAGITYFVADDGTGNEVWKTDGTPVGTVKLKDINAAAAGSSPSNLTMVGSTLYFRANDGADVELWKSDGTTAGTVKLDIHLTGSSNPTNFFAFSATTLFVSATNGTSGAELFKVVNGGTPTLVADWNAGTASSSPNSFALMGGFAYFSATTAATGSELFRTNGTSITVVKDIVNGTTGTGPRLLTTLGTYVYFSCAATLGNSANQELWRTDGTDAGTVLVKETRDGVLTGNPQNLTVYNNRLYFTANDGVNGTELWKHDPTLPIADANSTILFKNINPGSLSSSPSNFYIFGGKLYFRASTPTSGSEPWVTDGTAVNTTLFKEIGPGPSSGGFSYPVTVGSAMYFVGKDNTGSNVWVTDGRACGTFALSPYPTAATASSLNVAVTGTGGSKVIFAMAAEGTDRELFIADPSLVSFPVVPGISAQPGTQSITIGNPVNFNVTATGSGLTYQWQKNNVNISGATASSYSIPSVIDTDAGDYKVIVTGTCGQLTSNPATLTVIATTPANPPSALAYAPTTNSIGVSFTAASGSPTGYLVLRREGSAPTEVPVDGTTYTAGTLFGTSKVVSAGASTSGIDTGLAAATQVFYAIYSYNGGGSLIKYLSTPLTGFSFTLAAEPTDQPTNLVFSNLDGTTLSGTFTAAAGGAGSYIAIRKLDAAPTGVPLDGKSYTLGEAVGDGVVAYIGIAGTFGDSGLTPEAKYYYAIFSANGSGATLNYNIVTPLQNNVTTLAAEPLAASQVRFSAVTASAWTVAYTPPTPVAAGYLVLRQSGNTLTAQPVDGTTYALNGSVGAATVAYVGDKTTFNEALTLASFTYVVFAYNGTGATINYRTSTAPLGFITNDTSAPAITDDTVTPFAAGSALKIIASVSEPESSILEVTAAYRSINKGGLATTLPMNLNQGKYELTVPAVEIGDLGVEYTISATNSLSLKSTKAGKASLTMADQTVSFSAFGSDVTSYRIVSVPLDLTNKSIAEVFGDDLGTYDGVNWRMYRYDNGATTELLPTSQIDLGKGYWLIVKTNKTIDSGPGKTANVSVDAPFTYELKNGWNQIGNPYNFNMVWQDVLTASGVNLKLRTYSGSWADGPILKKFEGGFVLSNGTATLKFPTVYNTAAGRPSGEDNIMRNPIDQPNWEVLFDIKQNGMVNKLGGFGMNTRADALFDEFDDFTLPRFLDFVEVNHDKKFSGIPYTKDVVPTTTNYTWDFNVESNRSGAVDMKWDNSYFGIGDRELVLWDDEESVPVNMRSTDTYSFNQSGSRRFKLFYGDRKYIAEKTTKNDVLIHRLSPNPADGEVNVAFTIPGTEKSFVEIRVLNSLGQPVTSLFNGQLQGGYHEVTWSGADSQGMRPSQGVYLVEVSANGQRLAKRVVLK